MAYATGNEFIRLMDKGRTQTIVRHYLYFRFGARQQWVSWAGNWNLLMTADEARAEVAKIKANPVFSGCEFRLIRETSTSEKWEL